MLEESYYGMLDVRTGQSMLFMPRLPAEYAVWMGPIASPEAVAAAHGVDRVAYVDELAAVLSELEAPSVHVLCGENTDSGLHSHPAIFEGSAAFPLERRSLHRVLTHARVFKTADEVAVMRYAASVASAAHVKVMQAAKPGVYEYELEAAFLSHIYGEGSCRIAPYVPIFGSGSNGAILHYGHAGAPNSRRLEEGDMVLVDAGAEYYRYSSDITCCFPVGGRFSDKHKVVYNAVLAASRAVLAAAGPGSAWPDMHLLAERTMLSALKDSGLLRGEVDDMVKARLGAVFQPHGLGHLLGIETHDVGGYGEGLPPRSQEPGLKSLRTARVLEENMVLTVEPGCYFIDPLLDAALADPAHAPFLVPERIAEYRGFGGVRIEDDCVVTARGLESFNCVPRDVEDVEAVMAGAPWPKQ